MHQRHPCLIDLDERWSSANTALDAPEQVEKYGNSDPVIEGKEMLELEDFEITRAQIFAVRVQQLAAVPSDGVRLERRREFRVLDLDRQLSESSMNGIISREQFERSIDAGSEWRSN